MVQNLKWHCNHLWLYTQWCHDLSRGTISKDRRRHELKSMNNLSHNGVKINWNLTCRCVNMLRWRVWWRSLTQDGQTLQCRGWTGGDRERETEAAESWILQTIFSYLTVFWRHASVNRANLTTHKCLEAGNVMMSITQTPALEVYRRKSDSANHATCKIACKNEPKSVNKLHKSQLIKNLCSERSNFIAKCQIWKFKHILTIQLQLTF